MKSNIFILAMTILSMTSLSMHSLDSRIATLRKLHYTRTDSSLTLTSPNGHEVWAANSTQTITWTSTGKIDSVNIEYSPYADTNWISIATAVPNTGSYHWLVPSINSASVLIRISDSDDGSPSDQSDDVFAILIYTLTLTSPNGEEYWSSGNNQLITWNTFGFIDSVRLTYSLNAGTTWHTIAVRIPNENKYQWSVPEAETDSALVQVADVSDTTRQDISDNVFQIIKSSVTILYPNGDEILIGGSIDRIKWTSTGVTLESVKVEQSLDGGFNWDLITIMPNMFAGLRWVVPNEWTNEGIVRVSDPKESGLSDQSDDFFSIVVLPTDVSDAPVTQQQPEQFSLFQNYPNPFNLETNISFALPENSPVNLAIYNIEGKLVRTLFSGDMQRGEYLIQWDGRDQQGNMLASGVYIYKIWMTNWKAQRRLLLIK